MRYVLLVAMMIACGCIAGTRAVPAGEPVGESGDSERVPSEGVGSSAARVLSDQVAELTPRPDAAEVAEEPVAEPEAQAGRGGEAGAAGAPMPAVEPMPEPACVSMLLESHDKCDGICRGACSGNCSRKNTIDGSVLCDGACDGQCQGQCYLPCPR